MSIAVHDVLMGADRKWTRGFVCVLLCALWAWPIQVSAQAPRSSAHSALVSAKPVETRPPVREPSAEPPELAPPTLPNAAAIELALGELTRAVEQAQFLAAEDQARTLLMEGALSARQRNDALELLAIAQIAARRGAASESTLNELFARDPEHRPRVRDPGPSVEAAFERIHVARSTAGAPALQVPLSLSAWRDPEGRVLMEIALGPGRDAVDTVHLFAHAAPLARSAHAPSLTHDDAPMAPESSHIVAEVGMRSALTVAFPAPPKNARSVAFYVEARAPSGAVLGRDGSAEAPLKVQLGAPPPPAEEVPLRRRWWVWTSAAIALSGLAISGALAAQ